MGTDASEDMDAVCARRVRRSWEAAESWLGSAPLRQSHFELVAFVKLWTALTTLDASVAIAATCDADGLDDSALMSVESALTDVLIALVSLGKSLLAESISVVALLWIVLSCDWSPLRPPDSDRLAMSLTELSRLSRSAQ
jgi:hypothetical protein